MFYLTDSELFYKYQNPKSKKVYGTFDQVENTRNVPCIVESKTLCDDGQTDKQMERHTEVNVEIMI